MLHIEKVPDNIPELEVYLKENSDYKKPKVFRQNPAPKNKQFLAVFLHNNQRIEGYGSTLQTAVKDGLNKLSDPLIEEPINFKPGYKFETDRDEDPNDYTSLPG